MRNTLFTGLVAYFIQDQPDSTLSSFQEAMLQGLMALCKSETPQILSWYEDLESYWQEHLSHDEIEEQLEEFTTLFEVLSPEDLMTLALKCRTDIMLEDQPPLVYEVKNVYVTYTFQWEDGYQVEYNCRPLLPTQNRILFGTPFVSDLTHLFNRQVNEMLLSPGLDNLHDQSAHPFDAEKFKELLGALHTYVNLMPGTDREPYMDLVSRLTHQFGPGPALTMAEKEQPLEWLNNGGGF